MIARPEMVTSGADVAPGPGLARNLLDALNRVEAAIAVFTLFLTAGLIVADVLGRELFNHGVFGALRGSVYAMAITGLLGFGLCVASGSHMRIRIFDGLIPKSLEGVWVRLSDTISFLICAYFAYWAVLYVRETFLQHEVALSLNVVVWPFQLALPWMFISAGLRYLLFAIFPALRPIETEVPS